MLVQRRRDRDHEPDALDTFGEVQQIWHPWRRRYDLFLRYAALMAHPIMSVHWFWLPREPIAPPDAGNPEQTFYQVAKVDAGLLAWHFRLLDESGNVIARIDRTFRGIGREVSEIVHWKIPRILKASTAFHWHGLICSCPLAYPILNIWQGNIHCTLPLLI